MLPLKHARPFTNGLFTDAIALPSCPCNCDKLLEYVAMSKSSWAWGTCDCTLTSRIVSCSIHPLHNLRSLPFSLWLSCLCTWSGEQLGCCTCWALASHHFSLCGCGAPPQIRTWCLMCASRLTRGWACRARGAHTRPSVPESRSYPVVRFHETRGAMLRLRNRCVLLLHARASGELWCVNGSVQQWAVIKGCPRNHVRSSGESQTGGARTRPGKFCKRALGNETVWFSRKTLVLAMAFQLYHVVTFPVIRHKEWQWRAHCHATLRHCSNQPCIKHVRHISSCAFENSQIRAKRMTQLDVANDMCSRWASTLSRRCSCVKRCTSPSGNMSPILYWSLIGGLGGGVWGCGSNTFLLYTLHTLCTLYTLRTFYTPYTLYTSLTQGKRESSPSQKGKRENGVAHCWDRIPLGNQPRARTHKRNETKRFPAWTPPNLRCTIQQTQCTADVTKLAGSWLGKTIVSICKS